MDFLRQKLGFSSSSSSSNNNNNNTSNTPLTVHDVYTFGKPVGEGAFSVVRLAKNSTTGQDVAIKCISRKELSPEDENSIRTEINIMKSLNHPNIVKFVDSFEEEKFFYVVLEFLPGGELFDRLVQKTFYNEKEARDTVRIICEGIKYCHDRGIVHRDLKPENLLMESIDDDAKVKIADFGFATNVVGSSLTVACGTPGYVAPELVSNKPYGKPVDMWAIGVITYCLLGGYPPFDAETDKALFRKIRKGEYEFHPQFWNHVSTDAKNFISSLLQLDPEIRFTADQALQHPWLLQADTTLEQIDLSETIKNLKSYQKTRKFKGAAKALMAINRMAALTKASNNAASNDGENIEATASTTTTTTVETSNEANEANEINETNEETKNDVKESSSENTSTPVLNEANET